MDQGTVPPLAGPTSPVLTTEARELYRRALRDGATGPLPAGDDAVRQLLHLGLVEPDPAESGRYLPLDPQIAEARIGVAWRAKALDLLDQAADIRDELAPFVEEYQRMRQSAVRNDAFDRLRGRHAINFHLDSALGGCREELLTAQPGGGRSSAVLQEALGRDRPLLDRGASMRTLYQHSAQFDPVTRTYVTEVTALGAQVRTLDELFKRLIVVDRRLAFIPAADDDNSAVLIKDESVVRYLADIFDRNWQRATPFPTDYSTAATSAISTELRQTIVRLLIEGESESVIARRIGVSKRTCASHIARLKQELDAETLFQLGYRVAVQEAREGSAAPA
ncbi:LuxR family transcriptional regulator [Streptomyces albireticuli]|uniref:LuxR family transcriptional regulator n=1 Tax=Streptomyces albireticuli TaxID=1940 RepID=A0A2A2D7V8_9ACTN|nr:LuxR family transcriptional regulator [Streptomyces albireticuli]MCD9145108.1 LuxR family transcriptional regulator [Streptomyces albireticuli]MCD9164717.1 LuxR family transcriptional regulator [Streptomyces albireticuli]MCD9194982.1 LuxR family transcriptional regulator [Streptomyces albireticuli]PAU47420.1 LuxR family transcriptional regulator [Streptomyces albireticuli]